MNKKKLNLIVLSAGLLIGAIVFVLYFFIFYKQVESYTTSRNTAWKYRIKEGTKESGVIPVGNDKLFIHLKNPTDHEYYFKVLDKKTGKEVWAIDNIKERLIINKNNFQWKYYPRDSFLYFRDWMAPYKDDKFALSKINLYTGQILWTNEPMPLMTSHYYDMNQLSFHVTKGYICMLDDKYEHYYLFKDKNGAFVTTAHSKEDWQKNFRSITQEELKNYDIDNFIVAGRYLYNFHKMVMFAYPAKEWEFGEILLSNNQVITIDLQKVKGEFVIWVQSFDWKTGKRKANLTLARKYRKGYKVLQKANYLAIKEDSYEVIKLWKIDEEEWLDVLTVNEKYIRKVGMSAHELYYETAHPENHDRIIHTYDFKNQKSYWPIVRFLDEEFKTWGYTIDNRVCYQVAWDKQRKRKELHAVSIW